MKSLFEQLGGTYCKQGDYLIPNLALSKSKENDIGIYGQRNLKFLQEHRRLTYINLLTSGKLNEYLYEIDKQVRERFCRIVKQLKTAQGITEFTLHSPTSIYYRSPTYVLLMGINYSVIYFFFQHIKLPGICQGISSNSIVSVGISVVGKLILRPPKRMLPYIVSKYSSTTCAIGYVLIIVKSKEFI